MNIQYHLTEEEAREGLDGIYPKYNKNAMVLGFIFGLAAAGLILSMAMQGRVLVLYVVFAVLLAVLSVWFLLNRPIKIHFVARRSTSADNLYMLLFSPEGWIKPANGNKVKLHGDKEAHAVETKLTVSVRPDDKHTFVIPKTALQGKRLSEFCDLLNQAGCPVKRL